MPRHLRPRRIHRPVLRHGALLGAALVAVAGPGASAGQAAAEAEHLNSVATVADTSPPDPWEEGGMWDRLLSAEEDYQPSDEPRPLAPHSDVRDLAVGPDGTLYAAAAGSHAVLAIDPDSGEITAFAGQAAPQGLPSIDGAGRGFDGDGGPAEDARLWAPNGVAVGPDGTVYISDSGNSRIRAVDPEDGTIDTIAGGGRTVFAEGPGTDVWLADPRAIAVGPDEVLYIADFGADNIRALDLGDGTLSTVAGRHSPDDVPDEDDEDPEDAEVGEEVDLAEAVLRDPLDLHLAADGTLYVLDNPVESGEPRQVRAVDLESGTVTTVLAGTWSPRRIAGDDAGSLYIANAPEGQVGVMALAGADERRAGSDVTPVAGSTEVWDAWFEEGSRRKDEAPPDRGEGPDGLAIDPDPGGMVVAEDGTLYLADPAHDRILAVGDGLEDPGGAAGPRAPVALLVGGLVAAGVAVVVVAMRRRRAVAVH
jgi:DNA-binding beta-propeller fold protein YncE